MLPLVMFKAQESNSRIQCTILALRIRCDITECPSPAPLQAPPPQAPHRCAPPV